MGLEPATRCLEEQRQLSDAAFFSRGCDACHAVVPRASCCSRWRATFARARRFFATKAAREVGRFGGSLRDVQQLLGDASLSTTQKYLDADPRAQAKLVNNLWKSEE